uniref:Uncharacterized protein n=1 Tax=Leersia perrieri TaxID=77586 RepID=A0A0D9VGR5_9ORYZ
MPWITYEAQKPPLSKTNDVQSLRRRLSPVDHQEQTPRSSMRSKSIRVVGLEGKRVIKKDGSPLPLTSPSDAAIL